MSRKLLSTSLLLLASSAAFAPGQTPVYKLLWSPGSLAAPGGQPSAILEAAPGLFYVLGALDQSTFGASVFSITSAGTFKLLYSQPPYFTSIAFVQATNGRLYNPGFRGTTPRQNDYFSATAAGANLLEYPMPDNLGSAWETIVAPGTLYDIVGSSTQEGVTTADFAQISDNGQVTILHQFAGSDGYPTGTNLALGPDGSFYSIGTQQHGGISPGFIFRLTPAGEYSQLLAFPDFPTRGALPVIFASDGNLYGLFGAGGPSHSGTLYRATLSGQLHVLAYFPSTMATPQTLLQASDGNIYGSTNSNFIFRYDMTSHALTTAYQFVQGGAQGICYCQLIQGMDGKIYGVTANAGPYPGNGAVFSLDFGLPPPQPVVIALYPATAPVGKDVMLWGKYLLGATSVTFNGVPAIAIHRTSAQSVTATVPEGATSGPVTITTPNGSFTTTQSFAVE